jgi:hypothetical protein
MNEDALMVNLSQPTLFDFDETTTGAIELFPAVWSALEDISAPEAPIRESGLERLLAFNAPRLSPLVAYVTVTRITDPDLSLRARAIRTVGKVLTPDSLGRPAPEQVVRTLAAYLSQMRIRSIYSLLQAVDESPELEPYVARLLNMSPYSGSHLAEIAQDRKKSLSIRRQAVHFIGQVGFLDAVSALERLESRLGARLSGQQAMHFAPPASSDEVVLLPEVQRVLSVLKTL